MSTSWPYNTYLNNQTFGILQKEPGKGSGTLRPRNYICPSRLVYILCIPCYPIIPDLIRKWDTNSYYC